MTNITFIALCIFATVVFIHDVSEGYIEPVSAQLLNYGEMEWRY